MSQADDVAFVAAGVLAAMGLGVDDVTAETVADRLADEIGVSSRWMPGPITGDGGADSYLFEAMRPVARWAAPGPDLVAAVGEMLGQTAAEWLVPPVPGWGHPVLRLAVGGLDDAAQLAALESVAGVRLVPHVSRGAHRISWRWPLRVGVVAGLAAAEQVSQLTGDLTHLFTVAVVDPSAGPVELEILVLPDAEATVPDGVWAACVVVPGVHEPADLARALDRLDPCDPAAIVGILSSDLTWFPDVIAQLAHDEPLDVAVGLSAPGASVVADDDFLSLTLVRVWALRLADELDRLESSTVVAGSPVGAVAHDLRLLVADASFASELSGSTQLAGIVGSVDASGFSDVTTLRQRVAMAEALPLDEGATDDDTAAAPGDDNDRGAGGPVDEAPPDARRLQAQVVHPSTNKPVPDRFLAGTVNHLRVRIAAGVAEGAVVANALFSNPTPGREAELTVEVIAGDTHARRTLKLPAVADSPWTKVVPFEVPAGRERFEVYVQVWFSGRVVQSATLSGPVLAQDAPAAGAGLRLSVDSSTPPAAVHSMSPAGASFTIVPGLDGEPRLLELAQTRPISADGLAKAVAGVRAALLAAFLAPPADLAGAAAVLTQLAAKGSPLYRQLEADAYDDVEWVHVSSYGVADLPLELVYTHPMPDSKVEVPVCPTALAGALACAADCPDRARSDCVCPFGFWATSKVIERRKHTGDRTSAAAGAQRSISILAVAAAGVSVKADEVDPTATSRILAAVRSAVADGCFHPIAAWADLRTAAALPARMLVLVTHTLPGDDPQLQLGSDVIAVDTIERPFVNPSRAEPGPVVLAIGCDTGAVETGFADYVGLLFGCGAELVVSAISPVPGKNVADFLVRLFAALPAYLAAPGVHRFGEVLTAIRRQTVATGDVLALALTATGDADVALVGA